MTSSLFSLPLLESMDLNNNCHIDEFQSNSLQSIELSNNRLQGSIPRFIFELVNLTDLTLSLNNLTGIVKLNMFATLKNLERLNLSHNSLSVSTAIKLNSSFPNVLSICVNISLCCTPETNRTL